MPDILCKNNAQKGLHVLKIHQVPVFVLFSIYSSFRLFFFINCTSLFIYLLPFKIPYSTIPDFSISLSYIYIRSNIPRRLHCLEIFKPMFNDIIGGERFEETNGLLGKHWRSYQLKFPMQYVLLIERDRISTLAWSFFLKSRSRLSKSDIFYWIISQNVSSFSPFL